MRPRVHAIAFPSEIGDFAQEVRQVFLELGRTCVCEVTQESLRRQLGDFCALQDLARHRSDLTKKSLDVRPIAEQPARSCNFGKIESSALKKSVGDDSFSPAAFSGTSEISSKIDLTRHSVARTF